MMKKFFPSLVAASLMACSATQATAMTNDLDRISLAEDLEIVLMQDIAVGEITYSSLWAPCVAGGSLYLSKTRQPILDKDDDDRTKLRLKKVDEFSFDASLIMTDWLADKSDGEVQDQLYSWFTFSDCEKPVEDLFAINSIDGKTRTSEIFTELKERYIGQKAVELSELESFENTFAMERWDASFDADTGEFVMKLKRRTFREWEREYDDTTLILTCKGTSLGITLRLDDPVDDNGNVEIMHRATPFKASSTIWSVAEDRQSMDISNQDAARHLVSQMLDGSSLQLKAPFEWDYNTEVLDFDISNMRTHADNIRQYCPEPDLLGKP